MKQYTIKSQKALPESEVEIHVELSADALKTHRKEAIKKIGTEITLDGFRKGHIPENILIQKVGELAILEEASYKAIDAILPELLTETKVTIVSEPRVSIKKIAPENPLEFTIIFSVMPEVTLPDYKKIARDMNAKKEEAVSVTEKEINDFIENIRKGYAKSMSEIDAKDGEKKDAPLPEMTDEFVGTLGDFKSVDEFKEKIKENILHEKEHKAKEKKRLMLAESLIEKTKTIVPKALTEVELAKMVGRFQDDIARMNMKFDDYLARIKKSEEDLRKEWRPDAEKQAKLQITMSLIANTEKLLADEKAIDEEVKHLLEHYKDADPSRAKAYVATLLTNEKVFQFLENQK